MRRTTRGKRRAQPERRMWARGTGRASILALVVVVATVITSSAVPAYGDSLTALQAVGIRLTGDGGIADITSQMVSSSDGSRPESTTRSLDTRVWGRSLPLRVQTSYVHGSQQGTNLADLKGLSGRFIINITVLNTSVQPRLVTLDGGEQSYALAGTPLTVMASAELGSTDLSHVVTGASGPAGGEPVTTGAVGLGAQGRARVQYAALLVPPALPAATTFTFVEDADKFEVPIFHLAVQPGIAGASMASNVVRAVLGANAGARQLQMLAQLDHMSGSLKEVGEILREVNDQLSVASQDLAGPTLAGLQSSSARLTSTLMGVAEQLHSTSGCLQEAVGTATGPAARSGMTTGCQAALGLSEAPANVQAQIARAMGSMSDLIYGPSSQGSRATGIDDAAVPATVSVGRAGNEACSVSVAFSPMAGVPASVSRQARLVGEWTQALSTANSLCRTAISEKLQAVIGGREDLAGASCGSGDHVLGSLACQLSRASEAVSQAAAAHRNYLVSTLNDAFPLAPLANLGSALAHLRSALTAANLGSALEGTAALQAVAARFEDVRATIGDLDRYVSSRDPAAPGILDIAEQQVKALDETQATGDQSLITQARKVQTYVQSVCSTLPATTPSSGDAMSTLYNAVMAACDPGHLNMTAPREGHVGSVPDVETLPGLVIQGLETDHGRWQAVAHQASALHDALAKLTDTSKTDPGLMTQLGDAVAELQQAFTKPGAPGRSGLLDRIHRLLDELGGFDWVNQTFEAPRSTAMCASAGESAQIPVLQQIFDAYTALADCRSVFDTVVDRAAQTYATDLVQTTTGALNFSALSSVSTASVASADLKALLAAFDEGSTSAGRNVSGNLARAVDDLGQSLVDRQATATAGLSSTATQVISSITRSYAAAVGDPQNPDGVRGANAQLGRDFALLVSAIQGTGAGGLVGLLSASTGSVRGAENYVENQYAVQSDLTTLRSASSVQAKVVKKTLSETLSSAHGVLGASGAFGVSVPSGSHVTPVFTYQLGGDA